MKMRWLVMTALPLLAASAVAARSVGRTTLDEDKTAKSGLKRVHEDSEDREEFDREAWRKKLGASDLAQREKAFEELVELARRDDDARKAVEGWSKSEKDGELAWTSRLLLREVDHDGWGGFGARLPMRSWHFGPGGSSGGLGSGFDWEDFSRRFGELDSMFGDLRQEWGDMLHSMPAPSAGSTSSSKSLQLESGPDGVKCTVTEKVDGGPDKKNTYEAKSMEELLEAHPELRSELGGGAFQFHWGTPNDNGLFAPRSLQRVNPRSLPPRLGGSGSNDEDGPSTDRLGILCEGVGAERAAELKLESGVGLSVQQVVPGTIASQLGLQQGDVVTEVNGTTIRSRDDVKKVLAERAAADDVAVKVVDEEGKARTLTWRPKPSAKGDKAEKKSGSRNL